MFASLGALREALSCGGRASISLDAFVPADSEATFDDVDELRDQTATLVATYHCIDADPEALRTTLATSSGRYWFGRHLTDDESGETLDLIVSLARDATTGRPVVEHMQACRAAHWLCVVEAAAVSEGPSRRATPSR